TRVAPVGEPGAVPSSVGKSEDDFAGLALRAQRLQRLFEDLLRLGVGASLLHVGEVRLVGLDLRRRGWVFGVSICRQAASRAVPGVRDLGVDGKHRSSLMPVGTEVGDPLAWRCVASLSLPHRPGTYTTPSDGTATSHVKLLDSGVCRCLAGA